MVIEQSPLPESTLTWREMAKGLATGCAWMLFRNLCFAVIIGNLALFVGGMLYNAYTPDLPWLIRTGDYILQHHQLPQTDIFSWTFAHRPVVVYQWLFEVVLSIWHHGVSDSMFIRSFAIAMMGLYLFTMFLSPVYRKLPILIPLLVSTTALYVAAVNLSIRPMVVTAACLLVQYLLVQTYRENRIQKRVLIPIMGLIYCLWANMHTLIITGFLSLFLFALGDWMERRRTYEFAPIVPDIEGKPQGLRIYLVLAVVGFLASLINPYGLQMYTYFSSASSQKYLKDIIVELQSPNFHMLNYGYFAVLFGVFILLTARAKNVFSAQAWLHLFVFSMALLVYQRFVVWTAVFYLLILPKAIYHWWFQAQEHSAAIRKAVLDFEFYRPLLSVTIGVSIVLFLFFPKVLPSKLMKMKVYGNCISYMKGLDAYEGLKLHTDRLYNDPEIGSCFLIRHPEQKIFVDTRFDFYGTAFTRLTKDVTDMQDDWDRNLKKWRINTLILPTQTPLAQFLGMTPGYQTVYKDTHLSVFRTAGKD